MKIAVRLVYKNISGITIEYFSINIKNFTVFRHVDEIFLVFCFLLRHIVKLQKTANPKFYFRLAVIFFIFYDIYALTLWSFIKQ